MTEKLARIENKLATVFTGPRIFADNGQVRYPAVSIPPGGAKAVPDEYVKAWGSLKPKLTAYLRGMVNRGALVITRAEDKHIEAELARPEVPPAPPSLDGLQERGALLLVAEEENGDTLRGWLLHERREEIKTAINAKLRSLTPTQGPKAPVTPPPLKF
jgi:hypothetical protein